VVLTNKSKLVTHEDGLTAGTYRPNFDRNGLYA